MNLPEKLDPTIVEVRDDGSRITSQTVEAAKINEIIDYLAELSRPVKEEE